MIVRLFHGRFEVSFCRLLKCLHDLGWFVFSSTHLFSSPATWNTVESKRKIIPHLQGLLNQLPWNFMETKANHQKHQPDWAPDSAESAAAKAPIECSWLAKNQLREAKPFVFTLLEKIKKYCKVTSNGNKSRIKEFVYRSYHSHSGQWTSWFPALALLFQRFESRVNSFHESK